MPFYTQINRYSSNKERSAKILTYCDHPTVLKIVFNHNHPIESAHSLSFRPIVDITKEAFFELFRKGHTASSAHHWHETKLFLDSCEDKLLIADRATNPTNLI